MSKVYLTDTQINNSLLDCVELIKSQDKKPHIVTLYRGGLTMGTKLSHHLDAPLSIIDYQSYDGKNSKKPLLMKNAGISQDELIVLVDDICDKGSTLKITEEYIRAWFPFNKILIYTIVGSKKHPDHFNYSIEHFNNWVVFPWEQITDSRCVSCSYGEPCRNNPKTHTHCNKHDESFRNSDTCKKFSK